MSLPDLLLYISIFNIVFGGFVLERNPRSVQNVSFGLLSFGIGLWILGLYLLDATRSFYWPDKISNFGAIVIAGSLFVFTSIFPSALRQFEKINFKSKILLLSPLLALVILLPFNLFIKSSDFSSGIPEPENGPLFLLFAATLSTYVLFSLCNIYLQFKNSAGYKRQRILYVLLGLSIFLVSSLAFDLILPIFDRDAFWVTGAIASLFFTLLAAASVISYKLMDIRLLAGAIAANVLGLAVSSTVMVAALLEFRHRSRPAEILIPFGAVALFLMVRYFTTLLIQKYLLKNYFGFEKSMAELNERLRQELKLKSLIAVVGENLRRALGLSWVFYFQAGGKKIFSAPPDAVLPTLSQEIQGMHFFARALNRPFFFNDRELDFLQKVKNLPTGVLPIFESGELKGYFLLGPQSGFHGLSAEQIQSLHGAWQHIQTAYARAALRQDLEDRVESQVENIIEKNRRLREEIQSRLEFVKATTHQLRTPATALSGALQLLSKQPEGEKQKELISMAYQKSKQLIAVISGILNLAKVEQGNIRNTQESVDLNQVFANVLTVVGPLGSNKGLTIDFTVSDDLKVIGSKQYLEQAFANLLENAVEYTAEGTIRIYFMVEPEYVICCIKDTGPGIPEDLQSKIFNKNLHSSSSKGLGLGLYLVRTIINAHPKGHVWFETSTEGTTFFVRLKRSK